MCYETIIQGRIHSARCEGLLTADFLKNSCLWAIGGQFNFISKGSFFNIHNRMLTKAERNLWKCLWQMNKCQSVSWKRQIKSAYGIFWPWLILAPACRLASKFIINSTSRCNLSFWSFTAVVDDVIMRWNRAYNYCLLPWMDTNDCANLW